jgi:peptide/nickel transport system permease protein
LGTLIARRLLSLIPILLIVSFLVYLLIALVPGDAAVTLAGGENATPERIKQVKHELHLDEPFLQQYGRWLGDAVQGDLGKSLFTHVPVAEDIADRFPITFGLVVMAMLVGLIVGLPLGIFSALRPGGGVDKSSRFATSIGIAIPSYWLAIELVVLFAVTWRLLPPSGYVHFGDDPIGWLESITLPAIALAAWSAAGLSRQLRASLIDVLDTNYVRTGWAVGGKTRLVVARYALKNAAIPAVTVLGLQVGYLLGSTVIIEQIFSIPGMGTYFIRAIFSLDVPVIQGVVLVFVLVFVTLSLLVDLTYGFLNPKVRVT